MKEIPLFSGEKHKAADFLRDLMGNAPPGQPITVAEMRTRLKIIAAIEARQGDAPMLLEDADYEVLKTAVNTAPYGVAHVELLHIIDDVNDAKTVPVAPKAEAAAA